MITNGQDANDVNFNAAFVSKTDDTVKQGKLSLAQTGEGFTIDSVQQYVNDIGDVVGMTEDDATSKQYATNFAISNGQNRKQAIEALDFKFTGSGGHVHDGSDGNGGQISALDLIDANLFEAKRQVVVLAGSSGGTTNDVLTSLFTGKVPGGDVDTAGVVTVPPYNFCHIRGVDGMPFLSGTGAIVYGRISENAGDWTVDYYYLDASGNEVGHTFEAYADNIYFYYNEVFSFETRPTFQEESVINGGGGGGGAAAIEAVVTAGEDLDKGEIVEVSTSGVAFKYVPSVSPTFGRQLAIVKENILNTQDGTVLYGGVFDAGSSVFTKGREYYCSSTSTLVLKTDSSILTGVPLYRMGIALDTQKLAIDFKIEQSHDFPEQKDFNLFSYGQASELIFDNIQVSRYKDAASAVPVDGTGGSPTIANSVTIENSDKFYGSQAYRLRKGSGDGQGEGWAFDFPVPVVARTKVHTIQFDYIVNSGTFNTEDVHVYFYDVTNSQLIQPSAFKLLSISTTLTGKVSAEFQMPAACALGRVILHIASTNASVWVLNVDNIKIVPNKVNLGAVVTDLKHYTPTISHDTGGATNYTASAFWRQVGDKVAVEGNINFTGTSAAFSGVFISYPPGITPDTTKMSNTGANRNKLGYGSILDAGLTITELGIYYNDTSKVTLYVPGTRTGANPQPIDNGGITQAYPFASGAANGDTIKFYFEFPAAGKSSNLVLSQDASTRVVAMKAYLNTNTAVTASNPIKFNTVLNDTHAAYSTATGLYTVVVPGFYEISAALGGTTATNAGIYVQPSVGAVTYICQITAANFIYSGSTIVYLKAGETVGIYSDQTTTFRGGASLLSSVSLKLISGPEQIAASETIAARYFSTASTAINTSQSNYIPATKDYDTHNSYNTSTGYVVPAPGLYLIKCQYITAFYSTASTAVIYIQKNGANQGIGTAVIPSGVGGNYLVQASCIIKCVQGDVIRGSRVLTAGSTTEDGLAPSNFFEICRLGN